MSDIHLMYSKNEAEKKSHTWIKLQSLIYKRVQSSALLATFTPSNKKRLHHVHNMSKACAQRLLHVPSFQAEGKLAEPRNSLWLSLLKWLRSVQHYSSQLSFPEGSNEIVSCCCVVWDSDGNVTWVRWGTNIFILRLIFQTNTDAELTLQVFQHGKEILKRGSTNYLTGCLRNF